MKTAAACAKDAPAAAAAAAGADQSAAASERLASSTVKAKVSVEASCERARARTGFTDQEPAGAKAPGSPFVAKTALSPQKGVT